MTSRSPKSAAIAAPTHVAVAPKTAKPRAASPKWQTSKPKPHVNKRLSPEEEEALIGQHADFLSSLLPPPNKDAEGYIAIHRVALPGKGTAAEVYFSGYDVDTDELADPKKIGMPQIAIVQGARAPGSNITDPSLLPGGKTSLDLLNEADNGHFLEDRYGPGARLITKFVNSKREQRAWIEVRLTVPERRHHHHRSSKTSYYPEDEDDAPRTQQLSLDEYKAQKAKGLYKTPAAKPPTIAEYDGDDY